MKIKYALVLLGWLISNNLHALGKQDPKLTCYLDGPNFALHLKNTESFVWFDSLDIQSYTADLVQPILEAGEDKLNIQSSSLYLEMAEQSCTLDKSNAKQLARCQWDMAKKDSLNRSKLSFTYLGQSSLGSPQSVSVTRDLNLQAVDMTVEVISQTDPTTKQTQDRANAQIDLKVQVGTEVRHVHLTRNLGEWTSKTDRSDWDRCLITP